MKKTVAFLLIGLTCLQLVGCGNQNSDWLNPGAGVAWYPNTDAIKTQEAVQNATSSSSEEVVVETFNGSELTVEANGQADANMQAGAAQMDVNGQPNATGNIENVVPDGNVIQGQSEVAVANSGTLTSEPVEQTITSDENTEDAGTITSSGLGTPIEDTKPKTLGTYIGPVELEPVDITIQITYTPVKDPATENAVIVDLDEKHQQKPCLAKYQYFVHVDGKSVELTSDPDNEHILKAKDGTAYVVYVDEDEYNQNSSGKWKKNVFVVTGTVSGVKQSQDTAETSEESEAPVAE